MNTRILGLLVVAAALCAVTPSQANAAQPVLNLVVMDPLALPLSCECVEGYAQRDYDRLASYLEKTLNREVRIQYTESLAKAAKKVGGDRIHLIIGKDSVVRYDAVRNKIGVRPLVKLTDKQGLTTMTGLFTVPAKDPARQIADLAGYKIFFGPEDSAEKSQAAVDALKKAAVTVPDEVERRAGCAECAMDCLDSKHKPGAAAVISSYAVALLEGCGTIEPGSLKVVGQTEPVPFIRAFVTDGVSKKLGKRTLAALLAVAEESALLKALESRDGFVPVKETKGSEAQEQQSKKGQPSSEQSDAATSGGWPQWRGPDRNAVGVWLPEQLPEVPRAVWKKELSGTALAGVAATQHYVIVADRDATDRRDIFRCFRATDGESLWELNYPASGDLDYGNSPRATPLIYGDRVYVLGAFGDLSCARLEDGEVVWTKNLLSTFAAGLSTWGMCASPIIVDGKLIVNPGGKQASIVAMDPATGEVCWQTPGDRAAYSSFVVGRFGSVRQLVGYDAVSLGGWDIATGKRLWRLVPPVRGDFNVPTPVTLDGRVLVTTEGNGTRIYEFDTDGKICPEPLARNMDLGPDSSTPVVVGDRVYGCWGELYCLSVRDGLKPVWTAEDPAYENYVSLVAGNDRLLVTTDRGELLLVDISGDSYRLVSRLSLVDDDSDVLSHPAFVDRCLYIRDASSIRCIDFGKERIIGERGTSVSPHVKTYITRYASPSSSHSGLAKTAPISRDDSL